MILYTVRLLICWDLAILSTNTFLFCSFNQIDIGSIAIGKLADLVVVKENPLANFKTLYGTGHVKLDENNKPITVGGVKYTIKDGIVFDAKKLLQDVKNIVKADKENIKNGKTR